MYQDFRMADRWILTGQLRLQVRCTVLLALEKDEEREREGRLSVDVCVQCGVKGREERGTGGTEKVCATLHRTRAVQFAPTFFCPQQ